MRSGFSGRALCSLPKQPHCPFEVHNPKSFSCPNGRSHRLLGRESAAPDPIGVFVESVSPLASRDLVIAAFVGLFAALFGITLMRGIAGCPCLVGLSRRALMPAVAKNAAKFVLVSRAEVQH